jgi:hypothetical protein
LRKETAMDVVQYLQVMDDILVAAVITTMFSYMAYPEVKRIARVRVRANERAKYDRGSRS